jgi:hypothetical protein
MELFVVTDIDVDECDSDHPVATGGTAWVCRNWLPAAESLKPVGYEYATGLGDGGPRVPWESVLSFDPARPE